MDADGSLDRAALGRIVFADPAALRDLEAIVHPAVRPRILARIADAEANGAAAVVIEAIKLVEGGLAELCDEVWLVTCDPAVQRRRLVGRGPRRPTPISASPPRRASSERVRPSRHTGDRYVGRPRFDPCLRRPRPSRGPRDLAEPRQNARSIRARTGRLDGEMPDFRFVAPFEPTGDQPAGDRAPDRRPRSKGLQPPGPARRHRDRQDLHDRQVDRGSTTSRRSSSPTTRPSPRSSTPSSASSSRTTRSSTSSATSTTTSPRRTCRAATPTSRRTRRATTRSTGCGTPRRTRCSSAAT